MDYLLRLEAFEGPLDLLLHLIEKNELDISNIPLAEVASQYMEYIEAMQELSLDIVSEFLVIAATLLQIKSRMLLPRPVESELLEEEIDSGEEDDLQQALVEKLIEYRKFKQLALALRDMEGLQHKLYSRPPLDLSRFATDTVYNPVAGVTLFDLVDAFRQAMQRMEQEEPVSHVPRDEWSVTARMEEILGILRTAGGNVRFHQILGDSKHRPAIVVTFLAVLELARTCRVRLVQDRLFQEIRIVLTEVGSESPVGAYANA
jgi:segregation and condensation protein A